MEAPAAARLLVSHGARKTLRNKEGKTPLDLAKERGYESVMGALK
jgi:hypothetical protein